MIHEADKQLSIISGTSETTIWSTPLICDQDDVYFRFGGGTLATMLHRRLLESVVMKEGILFHWKYQYYKQ